ncbi:endonuclease [Aureisphaera galaxeae]|uniref:endonuclease n=1 Tax=Aureisphaera galaxeae TaxID=1538023 RepID=UPI00234FFDB5|nr:endonuclease [Aureisphaera galaxeae]MDC8003613.1 endonuclease [Aureisphaera galaxeae]
MKFYPLLLCLLGTASLFAQQPYYNDVDLSLTGQDLYLELQQKISIASSTYTYGDIRDDVKITDEDPANTNNVLLVYGYNDSDGNCLTDRTRDKDDFGGTSCEYNREHVFARSNANPPMGSADNGTTGIAADPHNVRPADQAMNGLKSNKKFASGSGNAGDVSSGNWYPGDEWKGDVARMMMYMYTRYGDRCLPSLQGVGSTQGSTDMLVLYLQWNADDPVNEFEDQRNPHLENVYGNRNPFIDNPYLATLIWGGPIAEDRWGLASTEDFDAWELTLAPNPTSEVVEVTSEWPLDSYSIYTITGQQITPSIPVNGATTINVSSLADGMYFISFEANGQRQVERLLVE